MESSKELALIIRGLEKEKLKYTISILKELKHKCSNSEFHKILNDEIKILNNQLSIDMSNFNDEQED